MTNSFVICGAFFIGIGVERWWPGALPFWVYLVIGGILALVGLVVGFRSDSGVRI